jgi:hypothetical protein
VRIGRSGGCTPEIRRAWLRQGHCRGRSRFGTDLRLRWRRQGARSGRRQRRAPRQRGLGRLDGKTRQQRHSRETDPAPLSYRDQLSTPDKCCRWLAGCFSRGAVRSAEQGREHHRPIAAGGRCRPAGAGDGRVPARLPLYLACPAARLAGSRKANLRHLHRTMTTPRPARARRPRTAPTLRQALRRQGAGAWLPVFRRQSSSLSPVSGRDQSPHSRHLCRSRWAIVVPSKRE